MESAVTELKFYTFNGEELANPQENDNKCFAKSMANRQMDVYYIRRNQYGFFNPYDDVVDKEDTFEKVKREAFDNYLYFLKTQNTKFLHNAERVI